MQSRQIGMRMCPRTIVLFILAMFIAVFGARTEEEAPDPEAPVAEVKAQKSKSKNRTVEPAKTFTPTEKIKADSSVSFPVDI